MNSRQRVVCGILAHRVCAYTANGVFPFERRAPAPDVSARRFGIGNLGPNAFEFIEWLAAAGQRLWQSALGPTGYGNSPYQSFSAFAGNPLLIASMN